MATIDPEEWLQTANRRMPKQPGVTNWFSGAQRPVRPGFYERHFTDSTIIEPRLSMQYWDGALWLVASSMRPHWRQVGDYPAWRGLEVELKHGQEVRLKRGSSTRRHGIGAGRSVRARLDRVDASLVVHCTLLEDDPLASVEPKRAGDAGYWHGLSFLDVART